MVAIKLLVLSLACVCATATSPITPATRNTIFADERFEGEVFEKVDAFDNIELTPRNVAVSPYRLPTTTAPSNYKVLWNINIADLSYSGRVDITLHATQANVNEIVIHSDHVDVSLVMLRQGNTFIPSTYTLQKEYQFLRVAVTNDVLEYNAANPVPYTLSIEFSAKMRTDMYGIYQSWYRNLGTDTTVRWMATTQFQATAARYAFPCYDEPSFKATFDVTIRRPTTYTSWFCTRLEKSVTSTDPNFLGYKEDTFYTTPVMSTYLLGLIVAEYQALQATNTDGHVMHEVIARPGAMSAGQGDYAQRAGQDLLAWMNKNTGYDFYDQNPNLKMTQAAIPDFGAGAMENWGLLTYREAYILFDDNESNSFYKQTIARTISHEIAHMWFGNLVTNDWWDALWLNEGFARFYQYFLTSEVEDFGLASRFINEQVHTSLLTDSSNNPHPLTNPGVGSPAAVSAMFSTISYNKGAAIIRMTEHFLGHEVHRIGLSNYLRKHQFDTVKPIDLFTDLEEAGYAHAAFNGYGDDFKFVDYYNSWTEQSGHPVLFVQIDQNSGQMTIYQRRFNINTGYSTRNTKYIIPITFTSSPNPDFSNTKPSHVLTKAVTTIDRNAYGNHWTILNIQQTGFYRVNYDDLSWDLIILALRGPDRAFIHEYNRAQIVNDVFQFARSGIMGYERAMNILSFLEFETEYTPWVAAITGFNWLRNRLQGTPYLTQLDAKIIEWSSLVISQLTYNVPDAGEDFMRSYLRYQIAPFLCNLNVQACRTAATEQFAQQRNGVKPVSPDNRNWVYCNALRNGNAEDFNYLWNRFLTHNVYTEKILILQSLGCTTHDASLTTLLNAIVQDNKIIRPQDYTSIMSFAVSGNEENTQKVFSYIRNNLQAVSTAFSTPVTPLSYVSARLRTEAEVVEFQTWAKATQTELGSAYNSVYQGAELTRDAIRWTTTIVGDLNSYFVNGNQVIEITTSSPASTASPVTSPSPPPLEISTPALPDSAVTTFVSTFMLALAAFAHFIL